MENSCNCADTVINRIYVGLFLQFSNEIKNDINQELVVVIYSSLVDYSPQCKNLVSYPVQNILENRLNSVRTSKFLKTSRCIVDMVDVCDTEGGEF